MKKNTLKILLVDDEPLALDLLENILRDNANVIVVGTAANKNIALKKMIELQPDVIFQDIQMEDTNGLELVDEYRKHHFKGEIVFVTAYRQYAIKAIKKSVFDYILKPVNQDDLDELIFRLLSERNYHNDIHHTKTEKLKIPTRTGFLLINIDDIVFCEAERNYTNIHDSTGNTIVTSMNLGEVELDLPEDIFFRISRSRIININFLESVNKGEKTCVIKKNDKRYILHISGTRINELENLI